jgi:hypothetical protein
VASLLSRVTTRTPVVTLNLGALGFVSSAPSGRVMYEVVVAGLDTDAVKC